MFSYHDLFCCQLQVDISGTAVFGFSGLASHHSHGVCLLARTGVDEVGEKGEEGWASERQSQNIFYVCELRIYVM